VKLSFQISSILVALLFVFTLNFKSILTFHYFVNQAEITELFCINKEKPKLECNGKCHLAKELVKVDVEKSENPFSESALQINFEVHSILPQYTVLLNAGLKTIAATYAYTNDETIDQFYTIASPPPKG
jgi:hypothetical protein